jgi:hypothetical protein
MNAPMDPAQRSKNATIIAMLGVALAAGIVITSLAPDPQAVEVPIGIQFGVNLALLLLGFRWLHIDSRQLDIRRPLWLNIGIVLLAAVFVPYYLYKTRPEGARLSAILMFFGLVMAIAFASGIGAALAAMLQPGGTPAATF